jgi:hypothetical protein
MRGLRGGEEEKGVEKKRKEWRRRERSGEGRK